MTAFRLIWEAEAQPARPTAEDLADAAPLGVGQGARRLMRRGLLRALAAEVLGVHPGAVVFERLSTNRVRVIAPEPRYVSLAQRGTWIALAISQAPVGVDVEQDPGEDPLPLNLLHPDERAEIEAAADPRRLFLHYWTAREAWLKAQGRGLDVELASIRASQTGPFTTLTEGGGASGRAQIIEREDAIAAIVELPSAP